MANSHTVLKISRPNVEQQNKLSCALGISRVLAQVLINRGLSDIKQAEKFLRSDLNDLNDPWSFPDMARVVARIKEAAARKERVLILGDYDVDGITSVALLKETLKSIGIEAQHYIPHRLKEGYGLTSEIVAKIKDSNSGLIITADCGTNSFKEIQVLREWGIDVIVTDHHEASIRNLPKAVGIINPKVSGEKVFKDLAGVGVAFKLCQALSEKNLFEKLDLVALGTVADVVPLLDENRIIARFGLANLSRTKRYGLKALMRSSRLRKRPITTEMVSFILGPRLNASGRMDHAELSLRLLLSEQESEADKLAEALERCNRQRQEVEGKILQEALGIIEKEIDFKKHKIIVLAKESWHEGVLGVVAARLTERFNRPTILISLGQKLCKGSGRSIDNFHLFKALVNCSGYLKSFGGHAHAAGLLIDRDNIDAFREQINRFAHQCLMLEDLLPSLDIEAELNLANLDFEVVRQLEMLEPFGPGNPPPLFFTRNLKLKGQPQILSRETLKFWVTDQNGSIFPAIGFGMAAFRENLIKAEFIDLVYIPRIDNWASYMGIILEIEDIFCR